MKKNKKVIQTISLLLAGSILFSGCASTTMIQSTPSGAKVYIDGESVGTTPYKHSDTKIVGSKTTVKLEKEGYDIFYTSFSRNEKADAGAIIGGILVLFPFFWTMKYKPIHKYELTSNNPQQEKQNTIKQNPPNVKSVAERLRELKQLLDEKLITKKEYEKEKKKILDEEEK